VSVLVCIGGAAKVVCPVVLALVRWEHEDWQAWQVTDGDSERAEHEHGEPLALGAQMAAALAAEARHQAEAPDRSPLAGIGYDPTRGELNLLDFAEVSQDDAIDGFVDTFAAADPDERMQLRSSLTMDDFYTVLVYARRAAVRAMRSADSRLALRAVIALAVIDLDRIDWRDLAWQVGILRYAFGRIGADTAEAFEQATALAAGQTARFLGSVERRSAASLSDWGYREIQTDAGAGFIEDDGRPYQPRSDLVGRARAVAAVLNDGTWRLGEPAVGSDLPAVWLRAGLADDLEPATRSITGCVKLQGSLIDQTSPGAPAQYMLVFLAETSHPRAATIIASAAGPSSGSSFAALGIAAGPLCAVVIARSVVRGTPSVETRVSLQRFRQALVKALTV
jgi:hypothetical protein